MPIKPENKGRYPKNWKQIRAEILKRAGDVCEFCEVPNGSCIIRPNSEDPSYWETAPEGEVGEVIMLLCKIRPVKIVLTIAHLDHTPENNQPENLAALCQRCHNYYDRDHRKQTRAKTRLGGTGSLF